jgi:hypothetical protein
LEIELRHLRGQFLGGLLTLGFVPLTILCEGLPLGIELGPLEIELRRLRGQFLGGLLALGFVPLTILGKGLALGVELGPLEIELRRLRGQFLRGLLALGFVPLTILGKGLPLGVEVSPLEIELRRLRGQFLGGLLALGLVPLTVLFKGLTLGVEVSPLKIELRRLRGQLLRGLLALGFVPLTVLCKGLMRRIFLSRLGTRVGGNRHLPHRRTGGIGCRRRFYAIVARIGPWGDRGQEGCVDDLQLDRPNAQVVAGGEFGLGKNLVVEPRLRGAAADLRAAIPRVDQAVQWLNPPSGKPQGALWSGADRTPRRAEPHDLAITGRPTDAKNEVAAGCNRRRLRFQAEHNNPLAHALDGSAERHRQGAFPATRRLGMGRQSGGARRAHPPVLQ